MTDVQKLKALEKLVDRPCNYFESCGKLAIVQIPEAKDLWACLAHLERNVNLRVRELRDFNQVSQR